MDKLPKPISIFDINDIIKLIELRLKCLWSNWIIQTTRDDFDMDLFLFRIHYKTYHQYKPTIYDDELKEIKNKSIVERNICQYKWFEIWLFIADLNKPTEWYYWPVPNWPYIFIKKDWQYIFKWTINVLKKRTWKKELINFLILYKWN